jgi:hypothetical protein
MRGYLWPGTLFWGIFAGEIRIEKAAGLYPQRHNIDAHP